MCVRRSSARPLARSLARSFFRSRCASGGERIGSSKGGEEELRLESPRQLTVPRLRLCLPPSLPVSLSLLAGAEKTTRLLLPPPFLRVVIFSSCLVLAFDCRRPIVHDTRGAQTPLSLSLPPSALLLSLHFAIYFPFFPSPSFSRPVLSLSLSLFNFPPSPSSCLTRSSFSLFFLSSFSSFDSTYWCSSQMR